jgi:hypothetical protein
MKSHIERLAEIEALCKRAKDKLSPKEARIVRAAEQREVPDPTPVEAPFGFSKVQPTLREMIQDHAATQRALLAAQSDAEYDMTPDEEDELLMAIVDEMEAPRSQEQLMDHDQEMELAALVIEAAERVAPDEIRAMRERLEQGPGAPAGEVEPSTEEETAP